MLALLGASSCKNADIDFPDYEGGSSVYFSYQTPVFTLVQGNNEVYDVTNDNKGIVDIFAVSGGTYNGIKASVPFSVDESLVKDAYYDKEKTQPIMALPSSYYSLSASSFEYNGHRASVQLQLNDEFFNDKNSVNTCYVLPLQMQSVSGADRILEEKSYMLFAIKYINKYHAEYLRRGTDNIVVGAEGGSTSEINVRHNGVEKDEAVKLVTTSRNTVVVNIPVLTSGGAQMSSLDGDLISCDLELTFDSNDQCTIKSLTDGITAEGTGHFGEKTEKLAWGNMDRDGIYLDYSLTVGDFTKIATKDTLVVKTRGVTSAHFDVFR